MKTYTPLLLVGLLLTQCKTRSYYIFSPPPTSTYEPLYASAANHIGYKNVAVDSLMHNATTPGDLESGQDSARLYSLHESPGSQKKVSTASKKPSLVDFSLEEQSKNYVRVKPDQDDRKPNALAHVSFFSALTLFLLYAFFAFSWILVGIFALLLPVLAVATGIISLPQIKKYHEMGKHLAIFGISVGGLAFILAIFALIQISKAPPI
jgi:hypothetical protein